MAFHPDIYVLVPFYVREDTRALEQCLRSLMHQSIDFRAVLVDDDSPADTASSTAALASDQRFELLKHSRRTGPAGARKSGLDMICSRASDDDVVVLLDGDDFLCRNTSLEIIRGRYRRAPKTKMTFGGMLVTGRSDLDRRSYRRWHLDLSLTRHLPSWRAPHPRTFRVGHYRRCAHRMKLKLPGGRWLPAATDMALLFPMLDECDAEEVAHIEETVYAYRYDCEAPRDTSYVRKQKFGEFFTRRSPLYVITKLLRRPSRIADAMLGAYEIFSERAE